MRFNVTGLVSVAVGLAAWEAVTSSGMVNPLVLGSPSRILAAAVLLFQDASFLDNVRTSAGEFSISIGLATVTGILLGFMSGWFRTLRNLLDPVTNVIYVTPRIALLPILVLWLGLGFWSTVAVAFLGAFFMVFIATMEGVKTADPNLIRAARSFGAGDLKVLRLVVFPSTVPFVVTGLRLGIARALLGVVIGELYGASSGLGFYIGLTGYTLQVDKMFVAVILIAGAGLVGNAALSWLERRFENWRPIPVGG
jgi:ABC-type nitrate/sulfonate/bicarbonate transport system permease component